MFLNYCRELKYLKAAHTDRANKQTLRMFSKCMLRKISYSYAFLYPPCIAKAQHVHIVCPRAQAPVLGPEKLPWIPRYFSLDWPPMSRQLDRSVRVGDVKNQGFHSQGLTETLSAPHVAHTGPVCSVSGLSSPDRSVWRIIKHSGSA